MTDLYDGDAQPDPPKLGEPFRHPIRTFREWMNSTVTVKWVFFAFIVLGCVSAYALYLNADTHSQQVIVAEHQAEYADYQAAIKDYDDCLTSAHTRDELRGVLLEMISLLPNQENPTVKAVSAKVSEKLPPRDCGDPPQPPQWLIDGQTPPTTVPG